MLKDLAKRLREIVQWMDKVDEALRQLQTSVDSIAEMAKRSQRSQRAEHLEGVKGVANATLEIRPDGVWVHLVNLDDDEMTFRFRADALGWAKLDEMVRGSLQKWASIKWPKEKGDPHG
jgi:hypothetical protein